MASSNRHWPSMFKSKPSCNNQQWSHHNKSSILSNSCGHSSGCEERTPDPKPRWNPKPEQIRILEAIFNSGLVNPPRDEIRRIRAQLQEYGNVGDANVFYWFQNRKSRSKHKKRALQAKIVTTTTTTVSNSSSSSSSPSDTHNINNNTNYNIMGGENFNGNSSNNNSINYYFQQYPIPNNNHHNNLDNTIHEIIPQEPIYHPLQQNSLYYASINNFDINNSHHDFMFNAGDPTHVVPPSDQTVHGFSSLFHEDILKINEAEKLKFQGDDLHELSSLVSSSTNSPSRVISIPTPISSCIDHILGVREATESTVFINGMAIGIPNTPVNVKEEFGEGVMLVHTSTGHAVVTDELGVTLYPLQHGASYHLVDITHVVSSPMLHNLDIAHDHLDSELPYQI